VTAEQWLFGATVDCIVPPDSATFAAEVSAEVRGTPDCPVPSEVSAPTVDCVRTLSVR
jgi:hypothetical protein